MKLGCHSRKEGLFQGISLFISLWHYALVNSISVCLLVLI
uniref:Uncharacterized protein n=1 Tax=Utricularia reniformis TaxID=192314 RepID=A0A1Y0B0Q8_9LAMI|nr:hypothetical protein AEK19_MT0712 [Utricularia reniformis]ART30958.1 hypothetical protein AEK19_MT0712 [Utricularia reniformis]